MARLLTSPIGSRTVREEGQSKGGQPLGVLRTSQLLDQGLIAFCSDCTVIPFDRTEPVHEIFHPTPKAEWCARCDDVVLASALVGEICAACIAGPRPPHLCKDYLKTTPKVVDMRDTIRGAKTHGL